MRHIVALFVVVALVGSSAPGWADSKSTAVEIGSQQEARSGDDQRADQGHVLRSRRNRSGLTAIVSPPTAGKVAMATCGGSWTVTTDMMRGRESLELVGDTTPHRTSALRLDAHVADRGAIGDSR